VHATAAAGSGFANAAILALIAFELSVMVIAVSFDR